MTRPVAPRATRLAPALLALLLLAACRAEAPATRTATAEPSGSPPAGQLLVGLATEDRRGSRRASFHAGEPIVLVLVAQNRGTAPATLRFLSGQRYDFSVQREGREVWRWSADRAFTMATDDLILRPSETRLFRETWPQTDSEGRQVPVGSYAVRAELTLGDPSAPERSQRLMTPPLPVAVTR